MYKDEESINQSVLVSYTALNFTVASSLVNVMIECCEETSGSQFSMPQTLQTTLYCKVDGNI